MTLQKKGTTDMTSQEKQYTWDQLLDRSAGFFRAISPENKICLVHHGDADGVTSAVYVSYVLKHLIGKFPETLIYAPSFSYDLETESALVMKARPDVLIVLDLSLYSQKTILKNWCENIRKVFVYDHHIVKQAPEYGNLVFFNPRLAVEKNISHPTSYFAYSLANRTIPEGKRGEWLAACGLVGDNSFDDYSELKEKTRNTYPFLFEPTPDEDYVDMLHGLTYLTNSGFFYRPDTRTNVSFEVLETAFRDDKPEKLFDKSIPLMDRAWQMYKNFQVDIKDTVEAAKTQGKFFDSAPVIFYRSKSPHYSAGISAGILSAIFPEKVCVLTYSSENSDKTSVEIRAGKNIKVNIPAILDKQRNEVHFFSAGGHPTAGGAQIPKGEEDVFIETFVKHFFSEDPRPQ